MTITIVRPKFPWKKPRWWWSWFRHRNGVFRVGDILNNVETGECLIFDAQDEYGIPIGRRP